MHKRQRSLSPPAAAAHAVIDVPDDEIADPIMGDLPDGYDSDSNPDSPINAAARAFVAEHDGTKPSVEAIWTALKSLGVPLAKRELKTSYEAARAVFKFRGLQMYESRASFASRASPRHNTGKGTADSMKPVRVLRNGQLWPRFVPLFQIYTAKTVCMSKEALAVNRIAQAARQAAASRQIASATATETSRVCALETVLGDDKVVVRHVGNRFAHRYACHVLSVYSRGNTRVHMQRVRRCWMRWRRGPSRSPLDCSKGESSVCSGVFSARAVACATCQHYLWCSSTQPP